jgi:outer membrane protein assembly factor BamD (BamD/ComL family)
VRQTSFVPLNIIPDSDSEGEVDNTQEIQIEEALKLYQRALRLHTDGEWEEAHKAYEDLFRSEIFEVDVEEEVMFQLCHTSQVIAAAAGELISWVAM